jgi:hypothetical protein
MPMKPAAQALRLGWLAFLLPGLAFAQTPTDARSASVALLNEAKGLAGAGKTAEACAKYAESYSLDAQLDALLPLADCFEQSGKLASAHAAFLDAVEVAQRASDQRWLVADERAKRLRPRLSYLTIDVPQERRLPALSIARDGFRLGSSGWGVPIPIDPGGHVIVVSAYGYRTWQTSVEVRGEGAAPFVEVPLLETASGPEGVRGVAQSAAVEPATPMATAAPPVVAAAPAPAPHAPARAPAKPPAPSGVARGHVAALVAGGVSVASLGLGFYFLARKQTTLSERDGICPSAKDCAPGTNAHLGRLTVQARNERSGEIACFAAGAAFAAFGAGLWLTAGKPSHSDTAAYVAPVIAPTGGGLMLGGRL